MKKLVILMVALATSTLLSAQYEADSWTKAQGSMDGFQVDSVYYTLVSDANVREKPNTQATVLTKLPIATAVKVIAVAPDSFTVRGVRMPWLQVSFSENGATKRGYVWGGFMATATLKTPNEEGYANQDVMYLAGIAAYEEKNYRLTAQIRVALKGKELAKAEFVTTGDLSYYPSFQVRFDEFENVKAVLMLNFQYPACGYSSGDNLVFWLKNNQLTKILEVSSMSDAGAVYSAEEYILPYDKGGISGHILVVNDSAEMKEVGDTYKVDKQDVKVTLHKWNGTKLVKLKEIVSK